MLFKIFLTTKGIIHELVLPHKKCKCEFGATTGACPDLVLAGQGLHAGLVTPTHQTLGGKSDTTVMHKCCTRKLPVIYQLGRTCLKNAIF